MREPRQWACLVGCVAVAALVSGCAQGGAGHGSSFAGAFRIFGAPSSGAPSEGEARTAFSVLASIPDNIAQQGPDVTAEWLRNRSRTADAFMIGSLAKCSAGVAVAIGSNLIAFSKVLKIRAAIKGLGGVAKVMQQIVDRTKRGEAFTTAVTEVFNEAGAGLGAIAAEFLAIDQVIEHCF